MKFNHKSTALLCASVLLFGTMSCNKEVNGCINDDKAISAAASEQVSEEGQEAEAPATMEPKELVEMTIAANDPSTKASFSNWNFAFEAGDKISVTNTEDDTYYTFSCGGSGKFSGKAALTEDTADWYAYFPAFADPATETISLVNQQNTIGVSTSQAKCANLAVLSAVAEGVEAKAKEMTFDMEYRTGFLVVTDNKKANDPANIAVMSGGNYVTGLKLNADKINFDLVTSSSASYLFSNTKSSDAQAVYYMVIPAGSNLTICDGDKAIYKNVTVQPGYYYEMEVGSFEENANCFVVKPGGKVYIDPIKATSATESEAIGTVSKVSVLWESFGTNVAPNSGDIVASAATVNTKEYGIKVVAGANEGNAVVAAYDASGNLAWSWHIWVESDDLDALAQTYSNGAGVVMDRYLGATSMDHSSVQNNGLFYQWGRKDPFLGGESKNSNTRAAYTGAASFSTATSTAQIGTISYAVANPTTYIMWNLTEDPGNHDWFRANESQREVSNSRWSPTKTNYDPCPAGWRVATGGRIANNGLWATAANIDTTDPVTEINITDNYDTYGYDFGKNHTSENSIRFSDSIESIWYPNCGYINGGDGGLMRVGQLNSPWSCSHSYNMESAISTDFNERAYAADFGVANNGGTVNKTACLFHCDYRADAESIRCVKDE